MLSSKSELTGWCSIGPFVRVYDEEYAFSLSSPSIECVRDDTLIMKHPFIIDASYVGHGATVRSFNG